MTYCYYNIYDEEICTNSSWDDWGRWVLAGVLVGAFILMLVSFLAFACTTARRRRNRGLKPYYGTSWAAPPAYSPEDPHPEAKELAESPAPSYYDATHNGGSASREQDGTEVQDGMRTTSTPSGDHGLAMPPRVADPDASRVHDETV